MDVFHDDENAMPKQTKSLWSKNKVDQENSSSAC